MSSSFIRFKENGFWAADGFAEAFQLLLFGEIQLQYQDTLPWLNEYKKSLAMESLPLVFGGMSMRLDETITDDTRKTTLLDLISTIQYKIANDPQYLTGSHLHDLRREVRHFLVGTGEFLWPTHEIERQIEEGPFSEELPAVTYQKGLDLLRMLIAGHLFFKTDTPITYWDV
ncbi:MAG: hypothetical protein QM731_13640 [Chitinophagaceae bacterium]